MLEPSLLAREPNNLSTPPELCVLANASQAFGAPRAWGWADWNCTARAVSLCKQTGAWALIRALESKHTLGNRRANCTLQLAAY